MVRTHVIKNIPTRPTRNPDLIIQSSFSIQPTLELVNISNLYNYKNLALAPFPSPNPPGTGLG